MVKYISHPKILISAFFKLRKDDTTLNLPINITGGTRINITGGTGIFSTWTMKYRKLYPVM